MIHRKQALTSLWRTVPYVLLGLGAGLLNGLLGAAGGILLVALLPHLPPPGLSSLAHASLSHDRRDILATALCVMLPVTAVSTLLYWLRGIRPESAMLWALLLPAAAGGVLGAYLLGRIPQGAIKRLFALVVVISGIRMLF